MDVRIDDPFEPRPARRRVSVSLWTEDDRVRALLLSLSPALAVLAGARSPDPGVPWDLITCAAVLGIALAAWTWKLRRGAARWLAGISLVGWTVAWVSAHMDRPGPGLVVMLLVGAVLTLLWPPPRVPGDPFVAWPPRLLSALPPLVLGWITWLVDDAAVAVSVVGLGGSVIAASVVHGESGGSRGVATLAGVAAAAWMVENALGWPWEPSTLAMFVASGVLVVGPAARRVLREREAWLDIMLASPPRIVVASFAMLCLLGTVLLGSPWADVRGEGIAPIDAAFTAVSAVCVTGLSVLDTSRDFSWFGQFGILILIQLGGLGIMTLASVAVVWAGRRMSLLAESATVATLGPEARADLSGSLRRVVTVTAISELVGVLALLPAFLTHGDPFGKALWRAVFTSVSAFCNAGFALQSDSLIPYQENPWVLGVVGALITVGGLGPAVVVALPGMLRGDAVDLHPRLVVVTSAVLVGVGSILILLFEAERSLLTLTPFHRVTNAVFQAVSPRTAGFNSVDLLEIHPATWAITLLLMFVGGSPGSTAGGAKTTTLAVLVVAVLATLRGRQFAEVGMRRIPHRTVYDAVAVVSVGLTFVASGVVAMLLTQNLPIHVAVFEVVSALGTVGLTIGGSSALDEVGKIVIMLCMFAGRVGPLTLFALMAERRRSSGLSFPEEPVPVG